MLKSLELADKHSQAALDQVDCLQKDEAAALFAAVAKIREIRHRALARAKGIDTGPFPEHLKGAKS